MGITVNAKLLEEIEEDESNQVDNQTNGKDNNKSKLVILRKKLMHNEIPYEPWIKKEIDKMEYEPMITKRIVCLVSDVYS